MATKDDPAVRESLEPYLGGIAGKRKRDSRPERVFQDPSQASLGLGHIVVCLDRSAAGEAALPFAHALAHSTGARLTLLHVLDAGRAITGHSGPGSGALDWEISRFEARQYLEEIQHRCELAGFEARTAVVQGDAAQQIVHFTWETRADLVILASHGAKGLNEWRLGSTAQKVVAYCQTSVLAVPSGHWKQPAEAEIRFRRIMTALDGSVRSECVLPTAERLALDHGAELVLAHVVPQPELTMPGPASDEDRELVDRLLRRNQRVGEQYLAQLAARLTARGLRVDSVLERRGEGARSLRRITEREGIDLTILSAHGNAGSSECLHGSVIHQLVCELTAPLLILQDLPREDIRRLTETRFVRKAPRQLTTPHHEARP